MDFENLVELSARRYGGFVLYANDDFFASKDNLLKPETPIFIDGKYTERGKWMDGWESRRRRVPGHDFAILRLGLPGVIRGLVIDTAFFRGNYPQAASLEGVNLPGQPTVEELLDESLVWEPILAKSDLKGDSKNIFEVASETRFTHVRFHIYPDGGVARLKIYGDVIADPRWLGLPGREQEVDLAAVECGALVTDCNDSFFGSRHNLIGPGRAANMGDGWETKRSRKEAPDWVVVQLAALGTIERVVLDTQHFRGNFPESAALYTTAVPPGVDPMAQPEEAWAEILPRTKLQAHTAHRYEEELRPHAPATHVRMRIWPDGGVSRLRLYGVVAQAGKEAQTLRYVNALPQASRTELLKKWCGSTAWAAALAARAPFASVADLIAAGAEVWEGLTAADWLEAFAAHPRIGEKKHDKMAMGEQAKVAEATADTLAKLAAINAAYEAKFGRVYLVFASGKSAEEMLAIAEARIQNSPDEELIQAKNEQWKITEKRLKTFFRRTP